MNRLTPNRRKIGDKKLFHLLVEKRLTQREAAAFFNVSDAAAGLAQQRDGQPAGTP